MLGYLILNGDPIDKLGAATKQYVDASSFNGVIAVNPLTTGTIDNVIIGSIVPKSGTFTTVTVTAQTGISPFNISSTTPVPNLSIGGTANNLSGTPNLPNGTSATTQAPLNNSNLLATTKYVDSAVSASVSTLSTTSISGGAANEILYQIGSSATGFISAPTTIGTMLIWNGSNFVWQNPMGNYAALSGSSTQVFNAANAITTTEVVTLGQANSIYSGLNSAQTFSKGQAGAIVTLAYATSLAWDCTTANNFTVTLTGNTTLAFPTNPQAGQSGILLVIQDATGGRTMAFASGFRFAGGTAPSLTATANAVDAIMYYVNSSNFIYITIANNIK